MVQMICCPLAILLHTRQAVLATAANLACKTDTNELSNMNVIAAIWTHVNYLPNTLMAAYVWELDLRDGFPIRSGGSALLCVQI